jgi:hypothetical protein
MHKKCTAQRLQCSSELLWDAVERGVFLTSNVVEGMVVAVTQARRCYRQCAGAVIEVEMM